MADLVTSINPTATGLLRALRTIPGLEIILGHFLEHNILMPLAGGSPVNPNM